MNFIYLISSIAIILLNAQGCNSKKQTITEGQNVQSTNSVSPNKENEMAWQDWNTAYKKAKKDKKLMLVDVYTDWCGWCKRMDANTYSKSKVQTAILKRCIPVKFNPEIKDVKYDYKDKSLDGSELLYSFVNNPNEIGFPMTVIVDPANNKLRWVQMGYMEADAFIQNMNEAISKTEK